MAVGRESQVTRMTLHLQTGTGENGKPIYARKALTNIQPSATPEALYQLAEAIASLQQWPLAAVEATTTERFVQA